MTQHVGEFTCLYELFKTTFHKIKTNGWVQFPCVNKIYHINAWVLFCISCTFKVQVKREVQTIYKISKFYSLGIKITGFIQNKSVDSNKIERLFFQPGGMKFKKWNVNIIWKWFCGINKITNKEIISKPSSSPSVWNQLLRWLVNHQHHQSDSLWVFNDFIKCLAFIHPIKSNKNGL